MPTLEESLEYQLGSGAVSSERVSELIASALAAFEDATFRRVTPPASGDADTVQILEVSGGVVKLPHARSITSVELSATRLSPTWVVAEGYDAATQHTESGYAWLELAPDAVGVVARVTGKFGMHPLPTTVFDGIVAFAAYLERARGADVEMTTHYHDDGPQQQVPGDQTPAAWRVAVARYKIKAPNLEIPLL